MSYPAPTNIEAYTIARIMLLVANSYGMVGTKYGEGRLYGQLIVDGATTDLSSPHASVFFGAVPTVGTRSPQLAREKIARLRKNPSHRSSWMSRNPAEAQYGGAIALPVSARPLGYLAWSGFPELVDEAYMLAVAVRVGIMDPSIARVTAKVSANPYFDLINADLHAIVMT